MKYRKIKHISFDTKKLNSFNQVKLLQFVIISLHYNVVHFTHLKINKFKYNILSSSKINKKMLITNVKNKVSQ